MIYDAEKIKMKYDCSYVMPCSDRQFVEREEEISLHIQRGFETERSEIGNFGYRRQCARIICLFI